MIETGVRRREFANGEDLARGLADWTADHLREAIAARGAALLIVARDGDRSRLGPKSLGKATRFVVDHAPCPVLLVWPEPAPAVATIPPPPPHPPGP